MSDLIDKQGAALTKALMEVARDAVAATEGATVADIIAALEAVAETLPAALSAALSARLPTIAEAAIAEAESEIRDARKESGTDFPPVEHPEAGDYEGWAGTASAALIAAAILAAQAATTGEAAKEAAATGLESARYRVQALADTAAGRTVNDTRLATFQANSDVVEALEFDAVSDGKTSKTCSSLNGARFRPTARNIPRPPLHGGCRSRLRPVTKGKRATAMETLEVRLRGRREHSRAWPTPTGFLTPTGPNSRPGPSRFPSRSAGRRAPRSRCFCTTTKPDLAEWPKPCPRPPRA